MENMDYFIVHKLEKWAEDKDNIYLKSDVFDSDSYIEKEDFGHALVIPKNGCKVTKINPVLGLCSKYSLNPFEVLTFIALDDKIVGVTFWDKPNQSEALRISSKKLY
jgi:hypothetical protein